MTIQKRLEELRRLVQDTSNEIFLHCAGPGFRIEGRYAAEDSDANTLALIPEHQRGGIAFVDLSSITFVEFRERWEYQRAIGIHKDQASDEEIAEFLKSHGEATKLNCERKINGWNETHQSPKLRAEWPADHTDTFRYNLLRLIHFLEKKFVKSDELFQTSLSKLIEIVFTAGKPGVLRQETVIFITLSATDFSSERKLQDLFDQLESVL
jgi:hypothetical protein